MVTPNKLLQAGLRRTTSLSERIDSFLEAVHREEEQLMLRQQQRQAQLLAAGGSRQTRSENFSIFKRLGMGIELGIFLFSRRSFPELQRHQISSIILV
jgi:hypothetical protein